MKKSIIAKKIGGGSTGIFLQKQDLRPRRPLSAIVAGISPASYRRRGREMAADGPIGKERADCE